MKQKSLYEIAMTPHSKAWYWVRDPLAWMIGLTVAGGAMAIFWLVTLLIWSVT